MSTINHTPEWCAAGLVKGTVIYPGTNRTVYVYPRGNILGKCLEIKGAKSNWNQGIRVCPGRVDGVAGSMPCVVENRSSKTVRLNADAVIARLRVCDETYDEILEIPDLKVDSEESNNGKGDREGTGFCSARR